MTKWKKAGVLVGILVIVCIVVALFMSGSGKDSPKEITSAYLKAMKEGNYAKAYGYAGVEFDKETYENSAELQKNLMKLTYAQMEYKIGEEIIEDNKATVRVTVRNVNYLDLLDEALFETLKEGRDDAYTEEVYKKSLENAEKQEETVLVNYRLKEENWVFDGSNSLLQAAMLGYLKLPDEVTE